MGNRLVSLKSRAGRWAGITRQHSSDRGQRQFRTLENCYVSQDGSELRHFPGYASIIDLTEANNPSGYCRYAVDAVRPVTDVALYSPFTRYTSYSSLDHQSLRSRAKPSTYFGFEQIGNEVFVIGESRFREDLVGTIDSVAIVASGPDFVYRLNMASTIANCSNIDSTGPGLNGLSTSDRVYVEGLTVDDTVLQALIDTELNGKIHDVDGIGASITLGTESAYGATYAAESATDGDVHRVRFSRDQQDAGAAGLNPYDADLDARPDDPDALTVWRVLDDFGLLSASGGDRPACHPAWVANRIRDFGDERATNAVEGIIYDGSPGAPLAGLSRREQRRLPYRPNIEPALDRIILAVPGYGCMFQVPAIAAIDPTDLSTQPTAPIIDTTETGIVTIANSDLDRPRALGIPKARAVDSFALDVLTPGVSAQTADRSMLQGWWGGTTPADNAGLSAGTYKLAFTWYDPATGEEGLPCETLTVEIPDVPSANKSGTPWIRIAFIHPGYHFCESAVYRMNIYMSAVDQDALSFYGSFDMTDVSNTDYTAGAPNRSVRSRSAKYGFTHTTPSAPDALVRWFDLPLPFQSTPDISGYLDSTRLAPQSASMPRGAEACKYIRGVLFSGGAMGNSGRSGQLWKGKATAIFSGQDKFFDGSGIIIRSHSVVNAQIPYSGSAIDGTPRDSTLGIAGRCFPDAYQGIEFLEEDLIPGSANIGRIDRVLNRKSQDSKDFLSPGSEPRNHHVEILSTVSGESDFDRIRQVDTIPGEPPSSWTSADREIRYLMPRGRLQISDPGEPGRASAAFIKIVDPEQGDDIRAIGQLGGSAIVCTQRETYSYSWYRNPAGEEPQLMSNEFGCIGANTMVEFDGGLAWLSDRGPVALGQGLQHVGLDIAEDFYGRSRRYLADKTGMMRHSWGVHDAQRGLVMWGLIRRRDDSNVSIQWEGATLGINDDWTDEQLSRMPCDEILIWSYRANAFTTWVPPAGLEVYWMRPLKAADGITRMCFLAADGRIYALDDEFSDRGQVSFADATIGTSNHIVTATASKTDFDLLTVSHTVGFSSEDTTTSGNRNETPHIAAGTIIEFLDEDGQVTSETTAFAAQSIDTVNKTADIILNDLRSWTEGQSIRICARQRMKIVSNYIGYESSDKFSVDAIQMRYVTKGFGHANAKVQAFKSEEGTGSGSTGRVENYTTGDTWETLGYQDPGQTVPAEIASLGRRKRFARGRVEGQEIALQIEITGEAQTRIQDISLEVG